ncbi:MAG: hypothetical protein ACJ75L_04275 [Gaiellaceae bacterium]
MAFLYVGVAYATRRSSWAVLGTIGFFAATVHYVVGSPMAIAEQAFGGGGTTCTATLAGETCTSSPAIGAWSPALALGLLGFWLVLLGLAGRRVADLAPGPSAPPAPE